MTFAQEAGTGAPADPTPGKNPKPYGIIGLVISTLAILLLTALFGVIAYLVSTAVRGFAALDRDFAALGKVDIKLLHQADPAVQNFFYVTTAILFICLFLAVVAIAAWRGGRGAGRLLAWRQSRDWPALIWCLLLLAAMPVYLLAAGFGIKTLYPEFKTWFFIPSGAAGIAMSFFVVVLLAPLAEELFFRGWVYTSLKSSFGVRVAAIVTTLFFAFAHSDGGLIYPLAVLVPGIVLVWVREMTGSTQASFLVHATYNGWAWGLLMIFGKSIV